MPYYSNTVHQQELKVQEQTDALDNTLRLENEGPQHIPEHGATHVPESLSKFSNYLQLRAQNRELVQKEGRRFYALELDKRFLKAAENTVLDAFQIGFKSTINGLKKSILLFRGERANQLCTKWSIERHAIQNNWEMGSDLIFHRRTCSKRTNLHTLFMPSRKVHLQKSWKASQRDTRNKKAEASISLHQSTPSSSEVCTEAEQRRYGKKNIDVNVEKEIVAQQKHWNEGQKHSSSFQISFTSTVPSSPWSDTESFFTRLKRATLHERKPIELELSVLQTVKKK